MPISLRSITAKLFARIGKQPEPTVKQPMQRRELFPLPEFAELTADEQAELAKRAPEILTGESPRPIRLSLQTRSYICAFADGTVVVSKSQRTHAAVYQVLQAMQQLDIPVRRAFVTSIDEIAKFYERGSNHAVASADLERMEKDVLRLLEEACEWQATDIDIDVMGQSAKVRFRVNDNWRDVRELGAEYARMFLTSAYNMANVSDSTYKENEYQMARISVGARVPLPKGLESIRLQYGPLAGFGRYVTMRLLFSRLSTSRKTVADLGYDAEQLKVLRSIRHTPFGVMMMTGPTGSGKSTTLAVSLEELHVEREGKMKVVTVEDPPEYDIRGARQSPIANVLMPEEREIAFAMAFNAKLREAPHAIMIGEVRDLPAAKFLFKASQSGHQVWSSLHCNSAIGVASRLKEIGIEHYLVTDSSLMIGMAFQRLVPKLCPHCCLRYDVRLVSEEVHDMINVICDGDVSGVRLRNRRGCSVCFRDERSDPGYSGQTVVAEVLQPDDDLLLATLDGRRKEAIEMWLSQTGAITVFEHALRKVLRGELDPYDVFTRVFDRSGLRRLSEDWRRRDVVWGGIAKRGRPSGPEQYSRAPGSLGGLAAGRGVVVGGRLPAGGGEARL